MNDPRASDSLSPADGGEGEDPGPIVRCHFTSNPSRLLIRKLSRLHRRSKSGGMVQEAPGNLEPARKLGRQGLHAKSLRGVMPAI